MYKLLLVPAIGLVPMTLPVPHWYVVEPEADVPPMAFKVTPPLGLQIVAAFEMEVGAVDNCATVTL